MTDDMNGKSRIILTILVFLLTAQAGINAWTVKTVLTMGGRITSIEASRFSAKDGLELWREISMIRAEMK